MARLTRTIQHLARSAVMLCTLVLDAARFLRLCLRSPAALAAENLFLRKQLALYQARHVKPRRATDATRVSPVVWLSPWFDWQPALAVVPPETFTRWRRQGVQPVLALAHRALDGPRSRWSCKRLIRQMARDNLTWGQRRIANELRLKLGLQVSPRTVRKYMPNASGTRAPGHRVPSQRWRTFVRNHAWDLIVRGMAADLYPRCAGRVGTDQTATGSGGGDRSVASGCAGDLHRVTPRAFPRLSAPASGLAAWSPVIVEVIRVDQRSPPDGRPSCTHDPGLATRATSVDRFDGCPAGAALVWVEQGQPSHAGCQAPEHRVGAGWFHGVEPHDEAVGQNNGAS